MDAHIPENAPPDLFITDSLDARPITPADYRRESLAFQELAAHMADQPEEALRKFVDMALEITGAVSGGLSLYEVDPSPGVFRWHFLRGTLADFNGAITPRNFSPCGITLDQKRPVLTLHPERVYSWLVDAGVALPEVLLVPLYLGGAEPLGTLWVVSETEGVFNRDHARILGELAAFVAVAVRIQRGKDVLVQALAEQTLLTQEMSHRVRNVLSVTDGMIRMSAKNSADKEELATTLSSRLHALSTAHALVSRELHTEARATQTDLGSLLREVLAPHERATGKGPRILLEGPPVPCGDHAMTGLALVFHELATNAVKYGALSTDEGAVRLSWRLAGDTLEITWAEHGGPPLEAPPKRAGFGSAVVRNTIKSQLGGAFTYDWPTQGLRLSLRLPSARVAL